MAIGSTLSGQVGFAIETTPGTRQLPTKWVEVLSENLTMGRKTIRSNAIGGGSSIVKPHTLLGQEPGGTITMEAAPENIGTLLRLCMGTPVTTGAGPYTHTYSRSLSNPLPTATFQVGAPDTGGTVRPFDFIGMMAQNWELSIRPDEYVQMSYTLAGRRAVSDQTLATPTWPTLTGPWTSVHATLTLLGGTESFQSLTIGADNKIDVSAVVSSVNPGERRVREVGRPMITGTIEQEFEDMTLFNAFTAGSVGALSLVITAGASASLTITGRVQFVEDNTPQMAGAEQIVTQSCPFEFVRDGANTDAQAFSAVLVTTVATV